MRRARQIVLLASLAAAMLPATAQAAVPPILNFQGILLDSVGGTVPDSTYSLTFRIFDADVGGGLRWSEAQVITTENGLFNTHLGNVNPIFDTVFDGPPDRWLEMQLSGNPFPYAPRSRLGSVGYAFRVSSIDDAAGGDIYGNVQVHSTVTIGNLNESTGGVLEVTNGTSVTISADGNTGLLRAPELDLGSINRTGRLDLSLLGSVNPILTATNFSTLGASLMLKDEGGLYTHSLEADANGTGGFFAVRRNTVSPALTVDGNSGGTGEPEVSITGSARSAIFNMGQTGDNSVSLPTDAIANTEILDEPGIAQGRGVGDVVVTGAASMIDVVTASITIPAPGYIVVEASGQARLFATTSLNTMDTQIDETAGGGTDNSYYHRVGLTPSNTSSIWLPIAARRTYFKASAGAYTFRWEAEDNSLLGSKNIWNPVITATYYPRSYGTVTTLVSSDDVAEFENAVAVSVTRTNGDGNTPTQSAYSVDLRELELKAAKARIEAERLERELLEARLQEQLNAGSSPNRD